MRDPKKYRIKEILDEKTKIFVPKYQRGYDWKGDEQVRDFFSDIFSCIEAKDNKDLFLGTTIFDVSREKEKEKVEIIDGQQRMTTIFIILIACRNYAKHVLKDDKMAFATQQKISKTDSFGEIEDFKMIGSDTISDVFSEMCGANWSGTFEDLIKKKNRNQQVKRQNARLKPVYDFAYSEIENYCQKDIEKLKIFLEQLYENTYVIKIDIEDKSEAFEIFERTNARGKYLEISDLLKNFLFSKNKEIDVQNIEEYWNKITENAGSSMLRMLKYFWVSRKGYISSRDLYRNIRYYANEIGINSFVEELQEFSRFYSVYFSKDETDFKKWMKEYGFAADDMYLNEATRSVAALKIFGVTQSIPLIYSGFRSYVFSNKKEPKDFLTFLRFIESYHFINNKICNRIGNQVEQNYAKWSSEFYNRKDFSFFSKEIINQLSEDIATQEEFLANFKLISYENQDDKMKIHYIFDRFANKGVKDGQRINLINYYNIQNQIKSSFNIEHLFNQSDAKSKDLEYIHEIGNLFVIPKQINGILSNSSFEKKIDIFLHPEKHRNNIKNIPGYLREFAMNNKEKKEWTRENIQKRTKELGLELYQISSQEFSYK